MSDDCPFCGIVAGDIPSYTVYEDEEVLSFLDVNPLSRGHTLVVPKTHHERVRDMPDATGDAVFTALRRLAPGVERAVDADAVTIGMNDGAAAGQEVPHVHGHIVPRYDGDSGGAIHSIVRTRPDLSDDELAAVADDITAAVNR